MLPAHPTAGVEEEPVGEGEAVVEHDVEGEVGPDQLVDAAAPQQQQLPEHAQTRGRGHLQMSCSH